MILCGLNLFLIGLRCNWKKGSLFSFRWNLSSSFGFRKTCRYWLLFPFLPVCFWHWHFYYVQRICCRLRLHSWSKYKKNYTVQNVTSLIWTDTEDRIVFMFQWRHTMKLQSNSGCNYPCACCVCLISHACTTVLNVASSQTFLLSVWQVLSCRDKSVLCQNKVEFALRKLA